MTPVFHINFRREAFQREVAMTRARVIALGVWLAYFGVIAVALGLYALNFAAITRRLGMLQRQAAVAQANRSDAVDWAHQANEMALVQRGVNDPRLWRARLQRLSEVLPPNVRLTSVEFNPGGVSGAGDWNRLVLAGSLRAAPGQDRMRGVADLVTRLQHDSVLVTHYKNIRLATTRVSDPSGPSAEFVVECRP